MVKSVYVPEAGGILDFADDITPQEISSYINAKYPRAAAPAAAPTPDESTVSQRLAYGLMRGITDIPGGIASLIYPEAGAAQTAAGRWSAGNRAYLQKQLNIDPTKEPSTAQYLAETLGSAASFLVPGTAVAKGAKLLGAGAKIAGGLGTATAASQGVALGAGSRADQIRQQLASGMQISEADQLAAQRLSGLIGASEALPMNKFFGPLTTILSKVPASKAAIVEKIISNRLAKVTRAGVEEAAQEVASGIANDLMEYGVYNPDVQIGQDLLSNAAGGAFAGSTLEGIIQLAAGRKLRGARQLQKDLDAEKQTNAAELRQAYIAQDADNLLASGVRGEVSIAEEEDPAGFTKFVLKDTVGTPIAEYESLDTARKVIDLYKQKSGIDVSVREPGVEPTPPPGPAVPTAPKVELKVGNRKFASVDDILAEKKKHTDEIAKINVFKNNPELLVKEAKAQGVAPGVYAKDLDIKIAKNQAQVSKYDQYINSLQQPPAEPVKAPVETAKATDEPFKTKETVRVYHSGSRGEGETGRWVSTNKRYASDYRPDLPLYYTDIPKDDPRLNRDKDFLPEQTVDNGYTFNFELTPEEAAGLKETARDEEIALEIEAAAPEMPIGAVEMPIEESRVLPDEIVDSETKPIPVGVEEEAPTQTVKRPSATDAQLTALKVEMFGEPLGYRQMTPEQLAAYEAERDKRFPPQDVNVPLSAGITGQTAPRNMREAVISGPVVKDYSPETQEWMSKVYTGLMNRLTPIVPTEATVNLKTLIDQGPGYLIRGQARPEQTPDGMKTVIDLSTGILKPGMSVEDAINTLADTMNHEIIHVLRDKGVIRPSEWKILSRAATNTNVPGKKYTYLDKAQAIYAPIGPNGEPVPMAEIYANPDAVVEEAVAEMYRNWVKDRAKPPQPAVGLFNRITEFFRRIFQTLRNARHQDIFEAIQRGEVGSRAASPLPKSGTRFSISPAFLRENLDYTEELKPGSNRKENFISDKMPASSAAVAFSRLNETRQRFPNPLRDGRTWVDTISFALNQRDKIIFPPGWAISMSNDVNSWATWMKGLTPDQLKGVDSGFASIDSISKEYQNGTATPEFTGTLLFWTYLSRMASSFPHESGFLDAAEGAQRFIRKSVDGTFTADRNLIAMTATGPAAKTLKKANGFSEDSLPADLAVAGRSDLDDWFLFVQRTIPDYSPGNSVTNNMNSYGRDFLYNMSAQSPDGGMSKLKAVHNLFSSKMSGPEIRRQFHRIRDEASLGFDNKILSFAILLSGRQDVLILDRIQINQLFGGGQTNKIYDDVASMFNGPRGLAIYEALERGLGNKINSLYSQIGRPNNGTLGRYHWESWIRSSGQIVAHPTIQALVNLAQKKPNPFVDIASAEGRYHRSTFGVQYFRRANGVTELVYTTVDGKEYSVRKEDLDNILSKSNLLKIEAIPKWFPGVADFEGGVVSWKDYPGVDITKVDAEIAKNGRLISNGSSNQAPNPSIGQNSAADAARIARARTAHDAANRIRWEFGVKPAGGKPTDRIPEPYSRKDRGNASGDVVATYEPKAGVAEILASAGVSHPSFNELSPSLENGKKFAKAISVAKENNVYGAAVYVYSPEEYRGMRMFLTQDGKAGFAVKPDGDIVSVFNQKGSPHTGVTIPAVQLAIQLGGRKLDGFDTVLPNLYSQAGMTVVSRTKFADLNGIRPEGWDYNTFSDFNAGKPDVVFMVFDQSNWSIYKPTDGQLFTSTNEDPYAAADETYRSAVEVQSNAAPKPPERAPTRFSAAPAIESDEFKRWFGRSKAVNPDGTPQRWLHGTPVSFKQFGKGRSGAVQGEDGPFFFSQDPAFVEDYSLRRNYAGGDRGPVEEGGRTIPVYLSVQRPFDYANPQDVAAVVTKLREMHENGRYPITDRYTADEVLENRLETLGYDIEDGDWPTIEKENVQRAIRELGYDGFFLKENKRRNLAVFKPQQVKSIFNTFSEGEATSPRFSAAPLPPYVEQQNANLFAPAPQISYRDMMFDWFFGHRNTGKTLQTMNGTVDISKGTMAGLSAKSAVVDKNAYLTHLESLLNEQQTGNFQRMQADYSATAALAWRRRSGHLTASMMLRGKLDINFERPGDIQSATMKVTDDPDNLKEIFKVMTEPGPDKADGTPTTKADIFKSYAVALRGEWLRSTGQNVPAAITPQYIRETVDFTRREYPEVVEAYNKYQRFNKNLLTAAKDAGIISQAELGRLTNQMNYYGFIYEAYGEPLGPSSSQKTASKFKLRPYTGTQYGGLSNDPMFVMIQNAQFWVDSIAKNLAATKAYNVAKLMGEARPLRSDESPDEMAGEAKDVMYYSEGGVVKKFAVKDPLLVAALGSDDRIDVGKFWQVLGVPAHVLRESVTRDPAFMARNLMRDTVAAWMNSGVDFVPVIDTIKGFTTALKGGASFEALSARGVVGSYDLAMMGPQEIADTFRRNAMPLNVHTVASVEGGTAAIRSLWNRLGTISEASDAATRIAVYDALKAQGMTDAEAAMQAIELLDFTRRGGSQTLGILTKLIPFLNARIQGMDVLYQAGRSGIRTATGGNRGERDANLGKKFLVRGGMLAALSVALEMLNDDDEDYKQLDNYIKEGNLLIPLKEFGLEGQFLAIPKAFENGLLFSTIPQQIYKTMSGDASVRDNVNLFFGQMSSTFGVNPIPQAILPAFEMITNHNFYTGLPLISEGKQRLAPELQYNTNTSQIAMLLGGLPIYYDFTTGRFGGMSPIMIDKLISGYGGPIGTYLVQGTSLAMQDFQIGPDRMPMELSNAPVIRSFFVDAKSKNPKVVTQAYELFRVADEANRTYSRLKQMGDAEALVEYVDANRDILSYKKYIFSLNDRLNKLSAQERAIERDSSMTAEEKIEAQRRLRDIRIRLSAQVFEINKKLGR